MNKRHSLIMETNCFKWVRTGPILLWLSSPHFVAGIHLCDRRQEKSRRMDSRPLPKAAGAGSKACGNDEWNDFSSYFFLSTPQSFLFPSRYPEDGFPPQTAGMTDRGMSAFWFFYCLPMLVCFASSPRMDSRPCQWLQGQAQRQAGMTNGTTFLLASSFPILSPSFFLLTGPFVPSAYPEDGFPPLPIAAGAGSTASGNDEKEKEIVLGFCGFSMLAYFVLACGWIPATNCGNDGRGDKSVLVSYYFSMSSYTVDMGTWIVV